MGNSKSKPKKGPEPSKPPLAPTPAPAAAAAPPKAVEEPKPAAAAPAKAAEEPVKPAETSPPPTEAKAPEPVAPAKRDSVKPAAEPAPAPAAESAPASAPAAKRESIKAPAKRESVKGAVAASIDANDNDYIEENAEDSHKFPIVLDCGSFLSKAGLSDSTTAPSFVVPTVIGRAKSNTKVEGWLGQKDIYVGQEAEDKEEELFIKWPIDRGVVALSNWEDMEKIWHYLFYSKLRIKPSEHAVVITEAPLTPKASRERTVKLMFNTFKVPALYIGNSAVFSLYASGRTTGAVVELGDACSHVVGVTSGHVIPSSITEVSIAGRDITELMFKLLSDRGITFATHKSAHDVSRELKERFGYVAADYDKEFEVAQDEDHEKTYDAPNGNSFTIGIERFKCGEALFQPSIVNPHLEQGGVHISVNDSIKGCNEDIQSQLYGNILLSGGTTMFAGFADRLKAELTKLAPSAVINIVRPPNRKYSAWVGAALFANEPLVKLLDKLVTKDEYAAEGYKVCEARFLSA